MVHIFITFIPIMCFCCMTLWPPEFNLAVHLALCILFVLCKHCDLTSTAAHPAFRYTLVPIFDISVDNDFLIACLYVCVYQRS